MSKKDNLKNLDNVSNSNLDVKKIVYALTGDLEKILDNKKEYIAFCKKYIGEDFETYTSNDLQQIYKIGEELLNQYFVTEGSFCNSEILIQLQYILNSIMYNIIIKQNKKTKIETNNLNNKLRDNIRESKRIKKDIEQKSKEIQHVKNDIKSIMTTIISIIPTAIAGIGKVSSNYILPFLSSIILFGIIMITFVYSIYQDKLKKSTWIFLILAIIICSVFWLSSFDINIDIKTINEIENNQEGVNSVE